MPMFEDKKKIASVIVKKIGEREQMGERHQEDGAVQDNSIALQSAAEEMMSAMESKDAKALMSALKSFIDMSRDMKEESES